MSLVTNIIHPRFALLMANKIDSVSYGFEKLAINTTHTVMMSIAGNPLPRNYLETFKQTKTPQEAIALLDTYTQDFFSTQNILNWAAENTKQQNSSVAMGHVVTLPVNKVEKSNRDASKQDAHSNQSNDWEQNNEQQVVITYFDETVQTFCCYTVACSRTSRNVAVMFARQNELRYNCIGSDRDQLIALFQMRGVQQELQNFCHEKKDESNVMDLIRLTQKMYSAVMLLDAYDVTNSHYRPKYWVIDRETGIFQKIEFRERYLTSNAKSA